MVEGKNSQPKRKIGAWISQDLYSKIESNLGSRTWTDTIAQGLELVLEKDQGNIVSIMEQAGASGQDGETLDKLRAEMSELRAEVRASQAANTEIEKYNLALSGELEQAHRDKEDLKEMYNKHVLQVQTLINQRAIEEAGNKKKWWEIWK